MQNSLMKYSSVDTETISVYDIFQEVICTLQKNISIWIKYKQNGQLLYIMP